MMRKLLYILLIICLASCKPSKPDGILSESKMERVLYDYHMAKALASTGDSTYIKGRAYVLASLQANGVTEAEFDSSMVWYTQHAEILQKIYQNIGERMTNELTSMGAATNTVNKYSNLTAQGDTANIWNGQSFYLLSNQGFTNRFTFEVKADTSFNAGDSFILSFRAQFLQQEGTRHGIAVLAVQYDNDSVNCLERHFYGSGDNTFPLNTTPQRSIKRVYGYVYMLSEWTPVPRRLFIFQPSLVRQRTSKPKPQPAPAQPAAPVKPDSLKPDSTKAAN